jgi:hypothetical protein
MKSNKRRVALTVDGYTRFCLTAIVVLMTVMVIGLWAEGVPSVGKAGAAAPAPVERYQPRSAVEIGQMVDLQKQTNDKLDEIKKLLESGNVKVQVVEGSANSSIPTKAVNTINTTNTTDTGVKDSGGSDAGQGNNP